MTSQQLESTCRQVCLKTNCLIWYTTITRNWNRHSVGQTGNKAAIINQNLKKGLGPETSFEKVDNWHVILSTTYSQVSPTQKGFVWTAAGHVGYCPGNMSVEWKKLLEQAENMKICSFFWRPTLQGLCRISWFWGTWSSILILSNFIKYVSPRISSCIASRACNHLVSLKKQFRSWIASQHIPPASTVRSTEGVPNITQQQ